MIINRDEKKKKVMCFDDFNNKTVSTRFGGKVGGRWKTATASI